MKANAQGWTLFALSLPAAIIGWLWLLLLCVVFVAEWGSLRFQGAGVLTARTRKWAAEFWGYSTTVGRAILYHPSAYDDPDINNRTERHEFVHIRQNEDACLWGFAGGALSSGTATALFGLSLGEFFGVWLSIWCWSVAAMLPNFVTAVMRFGWHGIYRDTEHERSAYAQTDPTGDPPLRSWAERRARERERQEGWLG